ncbi:MAG: sigma-70 family RNA polymerase sigma factor [Acidobacteria bacterium]|nr:sigma-70 family RNA polymerase sigma factor [Acidobacteriota bacterium]
MTIEPNEITRYLRDWRNGNASALDEILPLVYEELRRIARRYRSKERGEHTLQTTEIINEAYLKLLNQRENDWQDRTHFFAVAARVMRNLLVDYARTRNYRKRGSGAERVSLEDVAVFTDEPDDQILALDEALRNLAGFDERKSRIVELRYFGGLSAAETADVIGVSEITVKREWLKAKAWLYDAIAGS